MNVKRKMKIIETIINDLKTLYESKKSQGVFTRKPKFTFKDLLKFMLDMNKASLQTRINDFYDKTKNGEQPVSQQYISYLRELIDHSPFEKIFRALVEDEYSNGRNLPKWDGYHLLAVDGSKMQLPPDNKLRQEFGVTKPGNNPAAGVSLLYDVEHKWILDGILTHYDMNEKKEYKKHIEYLCTKLPNGVTVRVIKTILPSDELEVLLTNLFDHTDEELISLYFKRWGIETMYGRLKEVVGIEKFSGKTANSIRQDFWVSLVLMLSVEIFLSEANNVIQNKDKHKNNKHKRKARASNCVVTLRNRYIFHILFEPTAISEEEITEIISIIARSTSPIREGRSSPRKKSSRKVNHNIKSRL